MVQKIPDIASLTAEHRGLGLSKTIDLASNTNALGVSNCVVAALQRVSGKLHLYPDPSYLSLRFALSAHLNIATEEVILGTGSDGVIQMLGNTLLDRDSEVIVADPAFHRYEDAARLNRAKCHRVPLTADGVHDLEVMMSRVNDKTRLLFITNPHNPTGTIVTDNQLDDFLNRLPEHVIVVIDEAYHEYAASCPNYPRTLDYVRQERRNVIVLRTMSKVYALAGLRIGYGVMPRELVLRCESFRQTFNVSAIAELATIAALGDTPHLTRSLQMNETGKHYLYRAFNALELPYTPTHANFIWVDVKRDGREIAQALWKSHVMVRTGDIFGAPTHLRVTIGQPDENVEFVRLLGEVLSISSSIIEV
jgi:histidinol-phosphate aminotransferase